MSRSRMNRRIHDIYARDHEMLGHEGALACLTKSQQWNLSPVLQAGGIVVFPHITVQDCGHHVAAAVRAVLDSQADSVLVISVLHPWTPEMQEVRDRFAAGEEMTGHPMRGIQGERFSNREEWQLDHALLSWRYFWKVECERRQIAGPEVIECYPFLAGAQPETLPGYDDVARLAETAVIVSTADPFHHGIGYGDAPEIATYPQRGGLALARSSLETSNRLLAEGDYRGYLAHCVQARNDARDTGPLYRALRGPQTSTILDVVASDMTELYLAPPPTWVAGALFTWQ